MRCFTVNNTQVTEGIRVGHVISKRNPEEAFLALVYGYEGRRWLGFDHNTRWIIEETIDGWSVRLCGIVEKAGHYLVVDYWLNKYETGLVGSDEAVLVAWRFESRGGSRFVEACPLNGAVILATDLPRLYRDWTRYEVWVVAIMEPGQSVGLSLLNNADKSYTANLVWDGNELRVKRFSTAKKYKPIKLPIPADETKILRCITVHGSQKGSRVIVVGKGGSGPYIKIGYGMKPKSLVFAPDYKSLLARAGNTSRSMARCTLLRTPIGYMIADLEAENALEFGPGAALVFWTFDAAPEGTIDLVPEDATIIFFTDTRSGSATKQHQVRVLAVLQPGQRLGMIKHSPRGGDQQVMLTWDGRTTAVESSNSER